MQSITVLYTAIKFVIPAEAGIQKHWYRFLERICDRVLWVDNHSVKMIGKSEESLLVISNPDTVQGKRKEL